MRALALSLVLLLGAAPGGASAGRATVSLPGFSAAAQGPAGGTLVRGVFPSATAPQPLRTGFVYLPPAVDPARAYPVVYLLHGMPGAPDEYANALHIESVADRLISGGAVPPFIAVMPPAGRDVRYNGEWAGPWERYLVRDVVPWVDAHLPTRRSRAGRTIAGLSAGGYGAADIGLRSPAVFGRIASWSGYFHPLHDGPLAHASKAILAANDPFQLASARVALLRRLGTRFFLGSGPTHSHWFTEQQTIDFAAELRRLRLPATMLLVPSAKGQYATQLEAGLRWAVAI